MTPEKMIELVLSGQGDAVDEQQLIGLLWKGHPVECVRPLLRSKLEDAKALGSYIIYELGRKARPLIDDIVPLLDHSHAQRRADAINCLLQCSSEFDRRALGKIVGLLDDPDPFIHRQVMRFIWRCSHAQLYSGVTSAASLHPNSVFVDIRKIAARHTDQCRDFTDAQINKLVNHNDPVANRFAVAVAARPRIVIDYSRLDLVGDCLEDECTAFVDSARQTSFPSNAVKLASLKNIRASY